MKEKLYTAGQIGKKFGVSLKEVYSWKLKLIRAQLIRSGRLSGTMRIPNDNHGRWGVSAKLVRHFPKIPIKK